MTEGNTGGLDSLEYKRAKVDQIRAAAESDVAVQKTWAEIDELRLARDAEARDLLSRFWATGEVTAFAKDSERWARTEGPYDTFAGFGQMWINQVAKHAGDDPVVAEALMQALRTPVNLDEACSKFAEVESVTRDLARKGQPAAARIPLVLSIFWTTDPEDRRWPCMWPSAPEGMAQLGWVASWTNQDRYRAFQSAAQALCPDDVRQFDRLLWFLVKRQPFVGLNPRLGAMCREAADLMHSFQGNAGYAGETEEEHAASLARQLKGELSSAMLALMDEVREVVGLELEKSNLQLRTSFDSDAPYRADAYATWSLPGGMSSPALRLWATRSGMALGIYGGWGASVDDNRERLERVEPRLPPGSTFFQLRPHLTGDRLDPINDYPGGEIFAGHWWGWDQVPGDATARDLILDGVRSLTPALRDLNELMQKPEPADPLTGQGASDLTALVASFRSQRPYPNDKDSWHQEERRRFAEVLSAENLAIFDLDAFRQLINGRRYGGPGPQAVLNSTLSAMDSIALDAFAADLRTYLWGEGSDADRIDRALDWDDLGVKGLGESVLLKLFAITHPERFLPVFPLGGTKGKLAMLKRLDLPMPDEQHSRGEQHVAANDALREVTERLLPGDPWGQGQFLYWLLDYEEDEQTEEDRLPGLADELQMPGWFLDEIRDLLLGKGQVIFYGPPGTGKTFVAQKLAEAIQPDKERVRVIQFHPSMSYEDFFEGFRPKLESGQLVYELRPGPLAIMADRAERSPGQPHILIIDEINRANLPRVLGELLYLLEYRNKAVYTAYRPDEPFELPKNLYIIGTMNTADRSIAMIDAALRRRFHFIPFMPEEEALAGVLRDWLADRGEAEWVADLVDLVNARLVDLLGGPHLQVGHSHFMVKDAGKETPVLTLERLERIWKYDIYPYIEDQLYGRPEQLATFAWWHVYREATKSPDGAAAPTESSAQVVQDDGAD